MFSVRGKSGKIMAAAVVGLSEFRTDHGIPRIKVFTKEHVGEPIQGLDFIRRDPWEIPPPMFCQPASEIAIANAPPRTIIAPGGV